MHIDAVNSHRPLPLSHSYALEGNVDALHALITSGTPILSDSNSLSIWHFSAQGGNTDIIALVEQATKQRFSDQASHAPTDGPDAGHTVLLSTCLKKQWSLVEQLLPKADETTLHQLPFNDTMTDLSPAALIMQQGPPHLRSQLLQRISRDVTSDAEHLRMVAELMERSLQESLSEAKKQHLNGRVSSHYGEAGEKFYALGQPRDAYRCFVKARQFGEQQLIHCSTEIDILLQFGLNDKAHQKLIYFIHNALEKNELDFASHFIDKGLAIDPKHLEFLFCKIKLISLSRVTSTYTRSENIWKFYKQNHQILNQSYKCLYHIGCMLKEGGHQGHEELLERAFWLKISYKTPDEVIEAMPAIKKMLHQNRNNEKPIHYCFGSLDIDAIIAKMPQKCRERYQQLLSCYRESCIYRSFDYSTSFVAPQARGNPEELISLCNRAQRLGFPYASKVRRAIKHPLSETERHAFDQYLRSLDRYKLSDTYFVNANGAITSRSEHIIKDSDLRDLLIFNTETALNQNLSWNEIRSSVHDRFTECAPHCEYSIDCNCEPLIVKDTPYSICFQFEDLHRGHVLESTDLIFYFVLFDSSELFSKLLCRYRGRIVDLRDNLGNTLLHYCSLQVANSYFEYNENVLKITERLIEEAAKRNELADLINSRNNEGWNPLGILFSDNGFDNFYGDEYIKIFIRQPCLRVNDFLNNSTEMSVEKLLGGYTLYHFAIQHHMDDVIDALKERNRLLPAGSPPEAYVNFGFPALSPQHHMYSPVRLSQKSREPMQRIVQGIEQTCVQEEDGDESDDSDDESAPAFRYCEKLRTLASRIQATQGKYQVLAEDIVDQLNTPVHAHNQDREATRSLHQVKSKARVVHFHGVPLFPGQYTNFERRFVAEELCVTDENALGIHSRTSTVNARMRHLYDALQASNEEKKKLETYDAEFRRILGEKYLENEKEFLDVFKKFIYEFSDEKTMQTFWKAFPEAGHLITYRFPFVSTSKAPDHAVKYAIGSNAETALRGEKRLEPKYREGKPTHRLAGLLYILMHPEEDIQPDQSVHLIDMTRLLKSKQIQSSGPRIDHQLEVTFFGGIDAKHIQMVIPIVWPNLSKDFKSGYHDVIWGLSEKNMKKKVDTEKKKVDTEKMIQMFTNFALKVVETLAVEKDYHLFYLKPGGGISNFPLEPLSNNGGRSPLQKEIREGTVPTNGSPKEKLTHVSQEQTARRTSSSMLSSAYHFAPLTPQFSPAQAAAAAADPLSIQEDFEQIDLDQ